MSKYPRSININKTLSDFFLDLVLFHFPPEKENKLLDPTCGKKHLWGDLAQSKIDDNWNSFNILEKYEITFSDVKDFGQELVVDLENIDEEIDDTFDGIVYDPPYLFGSDADGGERAYDYSGPYKGYNQSYEDLMWFMEVANEKFPSLLKPEGKLVVKCSDQYHTESRKFYPHHITWVNKLDNFCLVDLMIRGYSNISPTAWQVKDRPCSIVSHTFFLVFKMAGNNG